MTTALPGACSGGGGNSEDIWSIKTSTRIPGGSAECVENRANPRSPSPPPLLPPPGRPALTSPGRPAGWLGAESGAAHVLHRVDREQSQQRLGHRRHALARYLACPLVRLAPRRHSFAKRKARQKTSDSAVNIKKDLDHEPSPRARCYARQMSGANQLALRPR
jgi:hypothetical protein